MDWEGKIVASHLTCTASGRPLQAGEVFFSALVLKDGLFQRLDFSAEVWPTQDHASFISWWRQKVPQPGNERKAFKLNAATLAQIFANLKDARTRPQQCLAYVVALALVRARKLQFITVQTDGGQQVLVVQDRHAGVAHRIRDPRLGTDEEAQVLHNLLELTSGGEIEDA